MSEVNQNGDVIKETEFSQWNTNEFSEKEKVKVLCLLLDYLKLEAVRTNATKHGTTEIVLRPQS